MKILKSPSTLVGEFKIDVYGIRELPPNSIDTFVDLGANVGMVSLLFRCCQPKARIVAVEPSPKSYAALVENMKNLEVETLNLAIGPGERVSQVHGRGLTERWDLADAGQPIPKRTITVPSMRLSTLFKRNSITGRVFLKSDIEGCERYFQNESETKLLQSCDVFIAEIHFNRTYNTPAIYLQWFHDVFITTHRIGHNEVRRKAMTVRCVKKDSAYELFPSVWRQKVEL